MAKHAHDGTGLGRGAILARTPATLYTCLALDKMAYSPAFAGWANAQLDVCELSFIHTIST